MFDNPELIKNADLPQSDTGSPMPFKMNGEHSLFLIYRIQDAESQYAVLSFDHCYAQKFGPPNDETIEGHNLYKYGLQPYDSFKVKNSPWIKDLKKINKVHPNYDSKKFKQYNHFIWTFHDSTFECIAKNCTYKILEGSILKVASKVLEENVVKV